MRDNTMKAWWILPIVAIVALTLPPEASSAAPQFEYQFHWGSLGSAPGQFNGHYGISAGSDGRIYICDQGNSRVQVFSSGGTFLTAWGGYGAAAGQFAYPIGIAAGADGRVYVADSGNRRIQAFDAEGTHITSWGSYGSGPGQFSWPHYIAIDDSGYVYVTDVYQSRVQKFTPDGAFVLTWDLMGQNGPGCGGAEGIEFSSTDGLIYVSTFTCDSNLPIQVYTREGAFVAQWGSYGSSPGQFPEDEVIRVNGGFLYATIPNMARIDIYRLDGAFLDSFGSPGPNPGQFGWPSAFVFSADDHLYVCEPYAGLVQAWQQQTTTGTRDGLVPPTLLAYPNPSRAGILVPSLPGSAVRVFDTSGRLVREFPPSSVDRVFWDGRDMHGVSRRGVFFARVSADDGVHVLKLFLLD